jgi:hypothetical protein
MKRFVQDYVEVGVPREDALCRWEALSEAERKEREERAERKEREERAERKEREERAERKEREERAIEVLNDNSSTEDAKNAARAMLTSLGINLGMCRAYSNNVLSSFLWVLCFACCVQLTPSPVSVTRARMQPVNSLTLLLCLSMHCLLVLDCSMNLYYDGFQNACRTNSG